MTIRSLVLGALLLSVAAPAAFAASAGGDNSQYRDKKNNGGALVTVMDSGIAAGSDISAFEAVDGTVNVSTGVAGDYWLGKSENGYNK